MNITRRTALTLISVGAFTAFTGKVSFAQQGLRTRRSLTGMALNDPDLSTYRDFVGLMQSKDQTQPLSWLGFANQHGSVNGGFNFCPHGDWYLLPWHRAYVSMYETAAQVLMNNNTFAMPYWNWTELRTMPEAFANPVYNGKPNPLFVPNRNPLTGSNALTDSIVGQTQVIDRINAETVFEAFGTSKNPSQADLNPGWVPAGGGAQGLLEQTPHNLIHNMIGAYMPTAGSPNDPIFFMHHSNIDRIWASWNALGRQNSTDPLWLNMPFTDNYLRPDGTPYSATVQDLQDINALGYTYDFLPQPDNRSPDTAREQRLLAVLHAAPGANVEGVQRFGGPNARAATALAPLGQTMTLTAETLKAVTTPAAGGRPAEVYALINDIAIGEGVKAIRVFVNSPNLTTNLPDTDPHYVTTFTFLDHRGLGAPGAAGAHAAPAAMGHERRHSVIVNLTDTLRRLHGFRRLRTGELTVQLIPVPASGVLLERVGKVVPSAVEIVVL